MATAYLMERIISMTDAATDQDHIEMVIYNIPTIPDRTSYILGRSDASPLPRMLELASSLEEAGCQCIAMPCVTAHYFHDRLEAATTVPIIHGIRECGQYLQDRGITKAGIMATDGTVSTDLFRTALLDFGIETLYPDAVHQQYVMDLIYQDVKASRPVHMDRFNAVADSLRASGAQVIILGCTELSIIKRDHSIGAGFLDVIDIISKCAVETCGQLKPEFKELIT